MKKDDKIKLHQEEDVNSLDLEKNQDSENNINVDNLIDVLQKSFEEEVTKLNAEIKEKDKNISYLKADIENIKRNAIKENQVRVNQQSMRVIGAFLSVFDDYQRSIDYAKEKNNVDILEGLLITYYSFLKAFKELDVVEISTDNIHFDPKIHEAISVIPTDKSENLNLIAQVVQKGFTYKNQLLRPAKVIIYG